MRLINDEDKDILKKNIIEEEKLSEEKILKENFYRDRENIGNSSIINLILFCDLMNDHIKEIKYKIKECEEILNRDNNGQNEKHEEYFMGRQKALYETEIFKELRYKKKINDEMEIQEIKENIRKSIEKYRADILRYERMKNKKEKIIKEMRRKTKISENIKKIFLNKIKPLKMKTMEEFMEIHGKEILSIINDKNLNIDSVMMIASSNLASENKDDDEYKELLNDMKMVCRGRIKEKEMEKLKIEYGRTIIQLFILMIKISTDIEKNMNLKVNIDRILEFDTGMETNYLMGFRCEPKVWKYIDKSIIYDMRVKFIEIYGKYEELLNRIIYSGTIRKKRKYLGTDKEEYRKLLTKELGEDPINLLYGKLKRLAMIYRCDDSLEKMDIKAEEDEMKKIKEIFNKNEDKAYENEKIKERKVTQQKIIEEIDKEIEEMDKRIGEKSKQIFEKGELIKVKKEGGEEKKERKEILELMAIKENIPTGTSRLPYQIQKEIYTLVNDIEQEFRMDESYYFDDKIINSKGKEKNIKKAKGKSQEKGKSTDNQTYAQEIRTKIMGMMNGIQKKIKDEGKKENTEEIDTTSKPKHMEIDTSSKSENIEKREGFNGQKGYTKFDVTFNEEEIEDYLYEIKKINDYFKIIEKKRKEGIKEKQEENMKLLEKGYERISKERLFVDKMYVIRTINDNMKIIIRNIKSYTNIKETEIEKEIENFNNIIDKMMKYKENIEKENRRENEKGAEDQKKKKQRIEKLQEELRKKYKEEDDKIEILKKTIKSKFVTRFFKYMEKYGDVDNKPLELICDEIFEQLEKEDKLYFYTKKKFGKFKDKIPAEAYFESLCENIDKEIEKELKEGAKSYYEIIEVMKKKENLMIERMNTDKENRNGEIIIIKQKIIFEYYDIFMDILNDGQNFEEKIKQKIFFAMFTIIGDRFMDLLNKEQKYEDVRELERTLENIKKEIEIYFNKKYEENKYDIYLETIDKIKYAENPKNDEKFKLLGLYKDTIKEMEEKDIYYYYTGMRRDGNKRNIKKSTPVEEIERELKDGIGKLNKDNEDLKLKQGEMKLKPYIENKMNEFKEDRKKYYKETYYDKILGPSFTKMEKIFSEKNIEIKIDNKIPGGLIQGNIIGKKQFEEIKQSIKPLFFGLGEKEQEQLMGEDPNEEKDEEIPMAVYESACIIWMTMLNLFNNAIENKEYIIKDDDKEEDKKNIGTSETKYDVPNKEFIEKQFKSSQNKQGSYSQSQFEAFPQPQNLERSNMDEIIEEEDKKEDQKEINRQTGEESYKEPSRKKMDSEEETEEKFLEQINNEEYLKNLESPQKKEDFNEFYRNQMGQSQSEINKYNKYKESSSRKLGKKQDKKPGDFLSSESKDEYNIIDIGEALENEDEPESDKYLFKREMYEGESSPLEESKENINYIDYYENKENEELYEEIEYGGMTLCQSQQLIEKIKKLKKSNKKEDTDKDGINIMEKISQNMAILYKNIIYDALAKKAIDTATEILRKRKNIEDLDENIYEIIVKNEYEKESIKESDEKKLIVRIIMNLVYDRKKAWGIKNECIKNLNEYTNNYKLKNKINFKEYIEEKIKELSLTVDEIKNMIDGGNLKSIEDKILYTNNEVTKTKDFQEAAKEYQISRGEKIYDLDIENITNGKLEDVISEFYIPILRSVFKFIYNIDSSLFEKYGIKVEKFNNINYMDMYVIDKINHGVYLPECMGTFFDNAYNKCNMDKQESIKTITNLEKILNYILLPGYKDIDCVGINLFKNEKRFNPIDLYVKEEKKYDQGIKEFIEKEINKYYIYLMKDDEEYENEEKDEINKIENNIQDIAAKVEKYMEDDNPIILQQKNDKLNKEKLNIKEFIEKVIEDNRENKDMQVAINNLNMIYCNKILGYECEEILKAHENKDKEKQNTYDLIEDIARKRIEIKTKNDKGKKDEAIIKKEEKNIADEIENDIKLKKKECEEEINKRIKFFKEKLNGIIRREYFEKFVYEKMAELKLNYEDINTIINTSVNNKEKYKKLLEKIKKDNLNEIKETSDFRDCILEYEIMTSKDIDKDEDDGYVLSDRVTNEIFENYYIPKLRGIFKFILDIAPYTFKDKMIRQNEFLYINYRDLYIMKKINKKTEKESKIKQLMREIDNVKNVSYENLIKQREIIDLQKKILDYILLPGYENIEYGNINIYMNKENCENLKNYEKYIKKDEKEEKKENEEEEIEISEDVKKGLKKDIVKYVIEKNIIRYHDIVFDIKKISTKKLEGDIDEKNLKIIMEIEKNMQQIDKIITMIKEKGENGEEQEDVYISQQDFIENFKGKNKKSGKYDKIIYPYIGICKNQYLVNEYDKIIRTHEKIKNNGIKTDEYDIIEYISKKRKAIRYEPNKEEEIIKEIEELKEESLKEIEKLKGDLIKIDIKLDDEEKNNLREYIKGKMKELRLNVRDIKVIINAEENKEEYERLQERLEGNILYDIFKSIDFNMAITERDEIENKDIKSIEKYMSSNNFYYIEVLRKYYLPKLQSVFKLIRDIWPQEFKEIVGDESLFKEEDRYNNISYERNSVINDIVEIGYRPQNLKEMWDITQKHIENKRLKKNEQGILEKQKNILDYILFPGYEEIKIELLSLYLNKENYNEINFDNEQQKITEDYGNYGNLVEDIISNIKKYNIMKFKDKTEISSEMNAEEIDIDSVIEFIDEKTRLDKQSQRRNKIKI